MGGKGIGFLIAIVVSIVIVIGVVVVGICRVVIDDVSRICDFLIVVESVDH